MKYRNTIPTRQLICLVLTVLSLTACLILASCGKKDHYFLLDLESNPDSGFAWEVTQADELFEVAKEYEPAKSGKKQDGGIDHFTLTPVEPGFTNVTFTYKNGKGDEKGAEYAYSIIVGEEMQIEVISSTGSMGGADLGSKSIPVPGIE